ncbi:hypothetical protein [Pseudomonas cichorii]|nr:hypothetical protein [Pseudomonas cichorii]
MFKPPGKSIALFATGITVGVVFTFCWITAQPSAALTQGLPSEWKAASAQFDLRIRERFVIGIPTWQLIEQLKAQGFTPTWYEVDGEYGAMRSEDRFVCRIVARVYWRPGPSGTVVAIRGQYREEGC